MKKTQKSLKKWGDQKWRTASGKKSSEGGGVYLPSKQHAKLKSTAAGRLKVSIANKVKRKATKEGRQHAQHGLNKGRNKS